ncbi:Hsp20/alpha crystallin family protein [Bacillus sp. REN3]|uniref:Hsp20/alpha crystallin family protein n=1 Tax=Bacillus sp. REN3 TaxID=2802440 RepID=UPI001AED23A4|nr:Hsp20/alpha crystallin family protein [Bacillus sp. REN3]
MATNHPDRPKRHEAFEQWFKSMNQLMQEQPVRGFLQTIDEFFKHPFPHSAFPIEMDETDKEYIVKAELPGVKKEDIAIDVIDNALTIAISKSEKLMIKDDLKQTLTQKTSQNRSSRTIPFSQRINEKKVKAIYKDGLLEVKIAKKQGRRIDISIDES